MVLFQFPFGHKATKDIQHVDPATNIAYDFPQRTANGLPYVPPDPLAVPPDPGNPLVDFPRVQQAVWHQWGNRKVHVKVLNIVYVKALGADVPDPDLYRIDFYNMQMIGNPVVVQGNGAQGTHCSSGIVFSNNAAQYGLAGAPYEFDAWLQGPLLIADILPHNTEPRDFCPLAVSAGLGHAHITLDVALLE